MCNIYGLSGQMLTCCTAHHDAFIYFVRGQEQGRILPRFSDHRQQQCYALDRLLDARMKATTVVLTYTTKRNLRLPGVCNSCMTAKSITWSTLDGPQESCNALRSIAPFGTRAAVGRAPLFQCRVWPTCPRDSEPNREKNLQPAGLAQPS